MVIMLGVSSYFNIIVRYEYKILRKINMENLSQNNLNQLIRETETDEYKELKLLRKRDFVGINSAGFALGFLACIVSIIAASIVFHFLHNFQSVILSSLVTLALFGTISLIIKSAVGYNPWTIYYCRVFSFFAERTEKYRRFVELDDYFSPLEKRIENERIRLEKDTISFLNELSAKITKLKADNINLIESLKYKRKWRSEYAPIVEKFTANYEEIKNSLDLVSKYLPLIKVNRDKSSEFSNLRWAIRAYDGGHSWLLWKLKFVFDWGSRRTQETVISKLKKSEPEFNNRMEEAIGKTWNSENPINTSNTIENKANIKSAQTATVSGSDRAKRINVTNVPTSQPTLNFENDKNQLIETANIPIPKQRVKQKMTYEGTIKPSPINYHEIAERKMQTGEKGELLVFGFEVKRIINEEGVEFVKLLEHTSKEKGDSYGYDIRSIENNEEIFIEVKTTTGKFWDSLFFTQHERNTMEQLGKKYYLYRIFDFNHEKNTGELYIFRGSDEINSYCNFLPTQYKLEPNLNEQ